MTQIKVSVIMSLAIIAAAFLNAGPAFADKPSWARGGHHEKQRQKERRHDRHQHRDHDRDSDYHDRDGPHFSSGRYFIDRHWGFTHDYYIHEYQTGHCPPGLFKTHRGCVPPGQARKWVIGRPLPHDVVYYDLPPYLAMGIGLPPPGYRFVRVASDILMIAIGTGMVMDAIYDLGMR